MMHEICRSRSSGEPGVLGEHTLFAVGSGDVRRHHREQSCKIGMRINEGRQAVDRRDETAGLGSQTEQLADQILLRATDFAGHAPKQIHRDIDLRRAVDVERGAEIGNRSGTHRQSSR